MLSYILFVKTKLYTKIKKLVKNLIYNELITITKKI